MKTFSYGRYFVGLIATLCIYYVAYLLFPRTFSFISVPFKGDKHDIIHYAKDYAEKTGLISPDYYTSACFETDTQAKNFLELEYGKDTLVDTIEKKLYQPYRWHVRFFQPHTILEQSFFITPDQQLYGFSTTLPDSFNRPCIAKEAAQTLAKKAAKELQINMADYTLVAPATNTAPCGRIDHTFIYEKHDAAKPEIAYRVKIVVGGDMVTSILQYIEVPDLFIKKYQEMRSFNNNVASVATFFMILLFLLLCGGFGAFYLIKHNLFSWNIALSTGAFFTLAALIFQVNSFSLVWMHYQTTQSIVTFLIMKILFIFMSCCATYGFTTFIVGVAEGLTRIAFTDHPQLWLSFTTNSSTKTVFHQTLLGYSIPSILLCFVMLFYYYMTRFYQWWMPTEMLVDPNMLAHSLPFLTPLIMAIQAGFIEECLFRAIPLASAHLIGKKYGNHKGWMILGFIIQMLIFAAAHANYPAQPYYARVVELLMPSALFGTVYLLYGLFSAILIHILFDLILMSIPLFMMQLPLQHISIIGCGTLPLLIILYRFFTHNTIGKQVITNQMWQAPVEKEQPIAQEQSIEQIQITRKKMFLISALGLTVFVGFLLLNKSTTSFSFFLNQTIAQENAFIDNKKPLPFIIGQLQDNPYALSQTYIWQKAQPHFQAYVDQGLIQLPQWAIRYAQFNGDIKERSEEIYYFYCSSFPSTLNRKKIVLHETRELPSLTKKEAKEKAHQMIADLYHYTKEQLLVIEKTLHKRPARQDWTFIFALKPEYVINGEIQERIRIDFAGDTLVDYQKYIYIPEEWMRTESTKNQINTIVYLILMIIGISIMLLGLYHCSLSVSFYTLPFKQLGFAILLLSLCGIGNYGLLFKRILVNCNTIEPLIGQILKGLFFKILTLVVYAAAIITSLYYALFSFYPTALLLNKQKAIVSTMFFGFGVGLFCSIPLLSTVLLTSFFNVPHPFVPHLLYLESLLPLYSIIYQAVVELLIVIVITLLFNHAVAYITNSWRQKHIIGCFIHCLLGAILISRTPFLLTHDIMILLWQSLIFGITFSFMYTLIGRYDRYHIIIFGLSWTIFSILTTTSVATFLPIAYPLIIYMLIILISYLQKILARNTNLKSFCHKSDNI